MIDKKILVTAGADKLANILLSLYEGNEDLQKQLDIIFAGLNEDPKKIISLIKKKITSLKKGTRFIDYYEGSSFANSIKQIPFHIMNDLLPKSPEAAMELMIIFMDTHDQVLNRCDDSDGSVGDVYRDTCKDMGIIAGKIDYSAEKLTDLVFDKFTKNDYGIYDEIISSFKESLGDKGLEILWKKLELIGEGEEKFKVKRGLKQIADCQKNIERYIQACSYTGGLQLKDRLEVAKRLIEQWRGEEALELLLSTNIEKGNFCEREWQGLKIQALELVGKYDDAQVERLNLLKETLDSNIYGSILKNTKPDLKESFHKDAIDLAFSSNNHHAALNFLIQIQEFEKAAHFVHINIQELSGERYTLLRGAAKLFHEIDPLAAILLYRKMLEAIVDEAKSKYYVYAAKDLVSCGLLSPYIMDWKNHLTHSQYLISLESKHKKKIRFWSEYQSAKKKQFIKDTKKKIKKGDL